MGSESAERFLLTQKTHLLGGKVHLLTRLFGEWVWAIVSHPSVERSEQMHSHGAFPNALLSLSSRRIVPATGGSI